jgi:hypothetical protein
LAQQKIGLHYGLTTLPYPRPLFLPALSTSIGQQLVSSSMHIHFIAPLLHLHNNLRIVHTLMIKLLPKKEIPFLQFGPAGDQSFLWLTLLPYS